MKLFLSISKPNTNHFRTSHFDTNDFNVNYFDTNHFSANYLKAELLQLNRTQFPSLGIFVSNQESWKSKKLRPLLLYQF